MRLLAFSFIAAMSVAGCGNQSANDQQTQQLANLTARLEAQVDAEEARQAETAYREALQLHCIRRVLFEDMATEPILDLNVRAQTMLAINTRDCPPEFQVAFVEHSQAWARSARVRAARTELNSGAGIGGSLVKSFLAEKFGINAAPMVDHLRADTELRKADEEAGQAIEDTYEVVKRLASARGIDPALAASTPPGPPPVAPAVPQNGPLLAGV